ncbi:MAG TPA: glycosyltransferase family 39 protein [Burkholderiaceae bacterium]|nr:glycosyltransferase family 39 protein [Burkholderiaceae bacterium]
MQRSIGRVALGRVPMRSVAAFVMALLWFGLVSLWWQDGDHGFDHRSASSWREADYAAIARGFALQDLNPLHPRVLWRGDTSGEVEMEVPVVPWLAAVAGRTFGYEDSLLRRVSTVFAAGAVALFGWLALTSLRPGPALVAWTFFATNPIVQSLATAMQPEAVMLFWVVLSVHAGLRWYDSGSITWWWTTAACVSLALLAKASAAYLLLFCGLLVLLREGGKGLLAPRTWLGLGLTLMGPLLWYTWARGVYADTGLSLGLSNETHWLSLAVLADPLKPIVGNLIAEAQFVLASVGAVLLVIAGLSDRRQAPVLCLLFSVALFYLASGDTSGEGWAWYYHIHSVTPAALLVGAGVQAISDAATSWQHRRQTLLAGALAVLVAWALLENVRGTVFLLAKRDAASPVFHECVKELATAIPTEARLLVRGGVSRDEHGHPVAYNDSLAFSWARRMGANFPSDVTSENVFATYSNRNPVWFWLTRADDAQTIKEYKALVEQASAYPVIAECSLDSAYSLVRLESR